MKFNKKLFGATVLMLGLMIASVTTSLADQRPGQGQRDPLGVLKRAITQANAPTLTTMQETDLTTLITNYQNAQPTEPDAAIEAARDAYNAAILAGDLAAAQAQATLIASRSAELINTKLQTLAKFEIDVLTNLSNGGQLDALSQKFNDDRLLNIIGSLAGPGFGGGPGGGGPGHGH